MKIVKELYDKLLVQKSNLEKEREEILELRERARTDGDLRENADYIKACSDLEHCNLEYIRVMKLLDNGFPVPVSTEFNTIDVGSKFHLKVTIRTNTAKIQPEEKQIDVYKYTNLGDKVIFEGDVVIAGEVEDSLFEGYMSSESINGKALMGKPLGKHVCTNSDGELLELEVSRI